MGVPPRLPNLAPADMQWVRWATQELSTISTKQGNIGATVAAVGQQAAAAHTAISVVHEKTAAQEAVNPTLPTAPPQVPSVPTLSSDHGTVTIKWDGLVHGNNSGGDFGSLTEPAVGFNHVSIERGTSNTGPWTPVGGFIRKTGTIVDTDVTVGLVYWYHFITTDNAQADSAPGDAASIVVKGVDLGSLDQDVTDALAAAQSAADAGLAAGQAGQAAAAAAQAASDSVAGQAADALQAASDAQQTAQSALAAAQEAAGGATSVQISNTAPDGDSAVLWIDTTNNANTPKRWNGSAWVAITDKAAVDAAAAAVAAQNAANAAQTTANSAVTAAQAAQSSANFAQTTADGKNTVFYQTAQPSTSGRKTGDVWFDTDDGYRLYVWNGSAWTSSQLGSNAISANAITATQLANGSVSGTQLATSVNNSISTAQSTANTAVTNAQTAQTAADNANTAALNAAGIANGKGKVWFQTTAPSPANTNDLWIDTTSSANTPKRYNGSAWVAVTDKAATDAASAAAAANTLANTANNAAQAAQTAANNAQTSANTAQTTANGKNTVTYSASAPSAGYTGRQGDVWFTQDGTGAVTGQYTWSGSAWITQTLTNSVIATLDAAKITTGTLAAARIGANSISANQMVTGTITAASGIIATAAITTANIQDLAVTSAKVTALDAGKITTGTLSANLIGANSIAASKLITGTITAASGVIADAAIVQAKIANAAVGTAQIADLAVNNAKINDLDGNKIQAATVVAGKLAANSVTTNNITAGAIDTNRIAAGAITADKVSLGSVSNASPTDRVPQAINNATFWAPALATTATFAGASQGAAVGVTVNSGYGPGLTVNNNGYAFITQQLPIPDSRKIVVSVVSDDFISGTSYQGVVNVRYFTTATSWVDVNVGANSAGATYTFPSNAITYYVYLSAANGKGYQRYVSAHVFEVIGNSTAGQAAQLSPAGLQLFDTNGQLALDLTTNAAQYLSIVNNTGAEPQTVAAIDSQGNAAFTEVSAGSGFDIQGTALTNLGEGTSLFNSTPNGGAWNPDTALLDRLARGVIYDVTWDSLDNYTVASGRASLRIAQDNFILEDGRQYMINVHTGGLQISNTLTNNIYLELQVSTTPIADITTGVNIFRGVIYGTQEGTWPIQLPIFSASAAVNTIAGSTTGLNNRVLPANIPIYWQLDLSMSANPTASWKLSEFGYARGLTVIDMGANDIMRPVNGADDLANVSNFVQIVSGGTATAGSGSTGKTATSKTVTFTAKDSKTYNNGGSTLVTGSGQYTNGAAMYVGTGASAMGSWFGQFRDSSNRTLNAVVGGKTVTAATLTLKNNYTYSSGGSNNQFGTSSSDTSPGPIGTPANNVFSASFAKGQTKSITLSPAIRSGLSSGTVKSFVLGVQSGQAGVYGYYAGATQSGPPKLTVTYH